MKTLLKLSSLMLLSAFLFTSCQKDQIEPSAKNTASNATSFSKQLETIGNKYLVKYPASGNLAKPQPNAGRCIAADAAGAAATALGGPLVAFFGASTMSIYDLYQQGAFSKIAGSDTPPSSNPQNPYNNIGLAHNQAVLGYIESHGGQDMNEDALQTFAADFVHTNLDPSFNDDQVSGYSTVNTYNKLFSNYNGDIDIILENAAQYGYITNEEKGILITYLNKFLELPLSDAISYSVDCENAVLNAVDLSDATKQKLLCSMSIARNSRTLYDNTGVQ